jgi:glycosyltransferase involved in cell wall biosynthesis
VIVPARNAAKTIGATLEALARQDFDRPFEVIVVDDQSSDETASIVETAPLEVTMLRSPNRGPGHARNVAVGASAASRLAFTDADCVPTRGWLREGIAALDRADLVQGAVLPDPSVVPLPFDRTVWVKEETGLYECASLFARRGLFDRIGGFEDWLQARIGKPLAEDAWFGWRARRAGARVAFSERALVHHAVFRRSAIDYLRERGRRAYFPALARRVPELREAFFYRRWFLSSRSAAFDAAVAGGALGALVSSPLPLAAAVPYTWQLAHRSIGWRQHAPKVATVEVIADAVSLASLVIGSIRWRAPVL